MGPCHSSSKAKKRAPEATKPVDPQPNSVPLQTINPQPVPNDPHPMHEEPKDIPLSPIQQESERHDLSAHKTPLKARNEPNIESSGLKASNQLEESLEKSNVISKNEPNPVQEVKVGSHFYYSHQENEGQKLAERNLEYEEHEFREPTDVKASLHSNQVNRREIFGEKNKNDFLLNRNTGDWDEPVEIEV